MKRFLPCVCLAFLAVACFQPKENLSEVALGLCKYIPDHGPVDGSEAYLTPEFYDAYVAAFDAPVADYGEIGENEWLFYFVTGNGEAEPAYTVQSVKKVDKTTATAHISVQQVWAGEIDPKEPVAEYEMPKSAVAVAPQETVREEWPEEEEEAATTKECPFCKSEISIDATRCPHCTSQLEEEKK